jgi:hypothetical protein
MPKDDGWSSYIRNPGGLLLKQHLSVILQNRFPKYLELLERVGFALQTDSDMQLFGQLVADIYEIGYTKAMQDFQGEVQKLGYNVKITAPEQTATDKKIFK